jgi:anti-sigma factor RsiW
MDCRSAHDLLALYFDGELDRAASRELEAHLDGCADCRAALIELDNLRRTLRDDLPRYAAPQALRERIQAETPQRQTVRTFPMRQRWLALAASWLVAFVAGAALVPLWLSHGGNAGEQTARDLFAGHWRALAAASPVDVVSTDRHTVKPWFAGKVAQAPLVQDFADRGFSLVGGRIDYVGSGRVPVLVYRHGQHLIDVFVLTQAEAGALSATERQGYWLEEVTLGGQPAAVVSDMDASERARFVQILAAAK